MTGPAPNITIPVREVLFESASIMEQRPCFKFICWDVPSDEERDIACALGWIGYVLGYPAGTRKNILAFQHYAWEFSWYDDIARAIGYTSEKQFYTRLKLINHGWHRNGETVAATLRQLANEDHPE